MKGVILAGGTGSRLAPLTNWTNKHLLPVYKQPMVFYPLQTLLQSGITDIMIVTGANHAQAFLEMLGSGAHLGCQLTYKIQDTAGGIAHALNLAKDFVAGEKVAVILGDNIYQHSYANEVADFIDGSDGAQIFITEVEDPSRYGVVEQDANGVVTKITEKPKNPASNWVQTGLYLYDETVFDKIANLSPSARGELEVSELNEMYRKEKRLTTAPVRGYWLDAGTHESLLEASLLVAEYGSVGLPKLKQDKSTTPRVTIGMVTYNSARYIEQCLNAFVAQSYPNSKLHVWDNNSTDGTRELLAHFEETHPNLLSVHFSDTNSGFGAAHNQLLKKAVGTYYLCANVDLLPEPDFIEKLVDVAEQNPTFGSFGGKLKTWNEGSETPRTNLIDSVGIGITPSHYAYDIGQAEVDLGQFNAPRPVFGISGAAALYRLNALRDIAYGETREEVFDEDFFLYKEDIDVAYRLQWAGWGSFYTPEAVAFHARTATGKGSFRARHAERRHRSARANAESFVNHVRLTRKNAAGLSLSVRWKTFWRNAFMSVYFLLFEPKTFAALRKLQLFQRPKKSPRRVSRTAIEGLFETA